MPLRQYALIADGERGALIGPRGNIAFLCAPQWHDDAVFSGLLGGAGAYSVTPQDARYVWGGHYDQDSLIWRSHWVSTTGIIECREALAFPGDRDRVVLLRRVEATRGDAHVLVELECRAEFGARPMTVRRSADGVWEGQSGDLAYRWSGAPASARLVDGRIRVALDVPEGGHHDLVLELSRQRPTGAPPDPDRAWARTDGPGRDSPPRLADSAAPGESAHSHAVLRGLTGSVGRHGRGRHDGPARARGPGPQLRLPLRLDPGPVLHRPGRRRGRQPRPARLRGRASSPPGSWRTARTCARRTPSTATRSPTSAPSGCPATPGHRCASATT